MSGDLSQFLEYHKQQILLDRERLTAKASNDNKENQVEEICAVSDCAENVPPERVVGESEKVPPTVTPIDLHNNHNDKKLALIDKLINCEAPFTSRSTDGRERYGAPFGVPSLRRGTYAPSGGLKAPHVGLGEYKDRVVVDLLTPKSDRSTITDSVETDVKAVQTDVTVTPQRTLTDELVDSAIAVHSTRNFGSSIFDQRLTTAQNEQLIRSNMDKPKSILSNRRRASTSRDRFSADCFSSPTASFLDNFSYTDRNEELERERMKRVTLQHDLMMQIEEKRQLSAMREEQERRERELEARRVEQQILRMQEHEERRLMRRHSDDLMRRRGELHEMQRPIGGSGWRGSRQEVDLLGYSPPVSRRPLPPSEPRYSRYDSTFTPSSILRRPDSTVNSVNSYDTLPLAHRTTRTSKFDRFDSLSRIDSITNRLETMSMRDGYTTDLSDLQRRHSATQQDLSLSPRMRRRHFEDSLPIPILKARSPVAKELRNAVPFRSSDRWQKTALESPRSSGSILGQLGPIRAQLQREQLRMDESLRRRGNLMRTRTTDDY